MEFQSGIETAVNVGIIGTMYSYASSKCVNVLVKQAVFNANSIQSDLVSLDCSIK